MAFVGLLSNSIVFVGYTFVSETYLLCVLITYSEVVLSTSTESEFDTNDLFQLSLEQFIEVNLNDDKKNKKTSI